MVKPEEIGWGRYGGYSGPFWVGRQKFVLPQNPTDEEKLVAVVTAIEAGRYDAINAYDVCLLTASLLGLCEKYYAVSELLGKVVEQFGYVATTLTEHDPRDVTFKLNSNKKWRFFIGGDEVDTLSEQERLFFLNANGRVDMWDDASVLHAKKWSASIASVWESPEHQRIQLAFCVDKVLGFALPSAKRVLAEAVEPMGVQAAFRASFLCYAVNNPVRADKHLKIALASTKNPKWSKEWLADVLQELTFGPKIAIYPIRYNAMRPVVERLYGVNLPDLADDLKNDSRYTSRFSDPTVLQKALIALGYDLGPKGADGVVGKKTREAILAFEFRNKIQTPDGMPDLDMVARLEDEITKQGINL